MLSSFHQAVSSQDWHQALRYLISYKCDPHQKGDSGLSAREIAIDKINRAIEVDYFCKTLFETPLEIALHRVASLGIKGDIEYIQGLVALGADVNQKNEHGDNALMFYLKRVSSIQNGNEKNFPSLKVIKFLISEGDLSFNKEQINPLIFVKEKFGEPLAKYMESLIPKDSKFSSAVKIQRAWRNLQYRRKNQKRFGKSSYGPIAKTEIMQNFPFHPKLFLQPSIPQTDNPIDPIKAKEWIDLHEKEDQTLAERVLEKIDQVSFERFLLGLQKSVEKWNTLIMSRPACERNYVILLDQREGKSIPWVTSLALPFLAHPPTQIITWDQLELIKNDTHHIVIFDDAIYSGNQMSGSLEAFLQLRTLPKHQHFLRAECHIVVPFISETGKKRLSEIEVNMIHHETIPDFDIEGLNIGKTATYFAHKIAQMGISTIKVISTGETIRGKPGIRFVPLTHEPYKSDYENWLREYLKAAYPVRSF